MKKKNTCSSTRDCCESTELYRFLFFFSSHALSFPNDQTLSHEGAGVEPSPAETLTARRQSDPRSQSSFSVVDGRWEIKRSKRRPLPWFFCPLSPSASYTQFHQYFTSSFYMLRSQKRKEILTTWVSWRLLDLWE